MKKMFIIILLLLFFSCKKENTCVVRSEKNTFYPCEGYPKIKTYVYDNNDNAYISGVTIDTVCDGGIIVELKITTNCN